MSNVLDRFVWKNIASGPCIAHCASCRLGSTIYVHGGVSEARSTTPLSSLYKFDTGQVSWCEIVKPGSPKLSHHCCVTLEDRYILFVGGWNGKERVSDVYLFDAEEETWSCCKATGFPSGGGLSSHTVTRLSKDEILVIGREGSLRTQRRHGNAYLLSGSISKRTFQYKEHPLGVASRSGHTTTLTKKGLAVAGGRSDKLFELHQMDHTSMNGSNLKLLPLMSSLSHTLPPLSKEPCGRKFHSAVLIGDSYVLIYGGETFDGRSKDPVSDLYLLDTTLHCSLKYLGKTNLKRSGSVCVTVGEYIYLHGGVGDGNNVTSSTYVLNT